MRCAELGIPYEFKNMALKDNEQKEAWFLKINPNGRAPAMVDPNQNDLVTFESGVHLCRSTSRPNHNTTCAIFLRAVEPYLYCISLTESCNSAGSMIHYLAMNYDPEHKLWPKVRNLPIEEHRAEFHAVYHVKVY